MMLTISRLITFFTLLFAFATAAETELPPHDGLSDSLPSEPRAQNNLIARSVNARDIFGRQSTCGSLNKYCASNDSCCPSTATCCAKSCTPLLGACCSDGSSCASNKKCCDDGCIPTLGECCGDGSYCTIELGSCFKDGSTWKCRKYGAGGLAAPALKMSKGLAMGGVAMAIGALV